MMAPWRNKRPLWFAVTILFLTTLACNAFAGTAEPGAELPPPPISVQVTETAVVPPAAVTQEVGAAATATLADGGGTAVAEATAVEDGGSPVVVAKVDLNVRTGPGVVYDRDGFVLQGEAVAVIGRDPASGWWQIQCPGRSDGSNCWVSGGSQYTEARNTAGVPVAAVPPTPTPRPTATAVVESGGMPIGGNMVAGGMALVAYRDSDAIWTMMLDLTQQPPQGGEPQQVVISPNIRDIFLSPDGQKIAYLVGTLDTNELRVINIDGSDGRTLVRSSDIEVTDASPSANLAALIGDVQWLADSERLAFNSQVINLNGPGLGEQEDLWTVTLAGTLSERFPADTGGGRFAVSPTDRVVFSQWDNVVRANLDTSDRQTVINFTFVNTASEYAFYPVPTWTVDGSAAYLAISGAEPFAGDVTNLWRVPVDGPAELIGVLDSLVLFDPVVWSPTGAHLAHVSQQTDGSARLLVGDGDGENLMPVAVDSRVAFLGWSRNGARYLYAGSGYFAVGALDGTAVDVVLPADQVAIDGAWLGNSSYLVVAGSGNAWTLLTGTVVGASQSLIEINSSVVDVYVP